MKRVLLIDDNKDLADGFSMILDEEGYEVLVGYDGAQAREYIEAGDYDVAFIDIKLPEVSGMELLSIATRLHPDKKLVLMTGFRIEQVMETVSGGSPVGVLRGPSSFDQVLEKLNSVGKGILLADIENQTLCSSIPQMLEQSGKHIVKLDSLESLPEMSEAPDVFLLDVNISIVRSLADYTELKRRFGNVTTVLLLDNTKRLEEGQDVLRALNITGCLLKPFTPEVLLDVLHEFDN
ncbi:MAG: response regulator [Gammaproteobacteria bacterium]|nr:response regulator [Gammaproteobacteria bacterium]